MERDLAGAEAPGVVHPEHVLDHELDTLVLQLQLTNQEQRLPH